ncbi:MAG TPA: hypothetical protein VN699_03450 [Pirellulales bacterium]|nr:hypothetical protein [Pirellulales bacterium]
MSPAKPNQWAAPCGWSCEMSEESLPVVKAAIASLKAAGLDAVIVYRDPTAPANEPDCGADFTMEAVAEWQAFAAEAAGYLCHASRVQAVKEQC